MQPHCPKKRTTKADQLALGQWATKEGCTSNKGPMKRGLPEAELKKEEEEEEEKKLKEE